MEPYICFICRDNSAILYKICTCVDSIICDDCFNNEDTQKMDKCGICRKKYDYNSSININKFSFFLTIYCFKYIFLGSIISIFLCITYNI